MALPCQFLFDFWVLGIFCFSVKKLNSCLTSYDNYFAQDKNQSISITLFWLYNWVDVQGTVEFRLVVDNKNILYTCSPNTVYMLSDTPIDNQKDFHRKHRSHIGIGAIQKCTCDDISNKRYPISQVLLNEGLQSWFIITWRLDCEYIWGKKFLNFKY